MSTLAERFRNVQPWKLTESEQAEWWYWHMWWKRRKWRNAPYKATQSATRRGTRHSRETHTEWRKAA